MQNLDPRVSAAINTSAFVLDKFGNLNPYSNTASVPNFSSNSTVQPDKQPISFNQDSNEYISKLEQDNKRLTDALRPSYPDYNGWSMSDVFQELMDRELDIESLYVKAISMGLPDEIMEFIHAQIQSKSQSRVYLATILNFISTNTKR